MEQHDSHSSLHVKQKLLLQTEGGFDSSRLEQVPNGVHLRQENGVLEKGTPISSRVYSRKRGREAETTHEAASRKKRLAAPEQRIDGLIGKTADSLLVLAGLRKLSGGGAATPTERQLAVDVQRNLESLVARVGPSSFFDKRSLENMLDTLNCRLTADHKIEARPIEVVRPKPDGDEADSDSENTENANRNGLAETPPIGSLLSPSMLSFEDEVDADSRQADDYEDFQDEHSMYIRHKHLAKLVQQLKAESYVPQPLAPISNAYMNTMAPCAVCQVMVKEMTNVLVCDGCDRIHHQKCLPAVKLLPKGDWYCQKCVIEGGGKTQPHKYGSVRKGVFVPPISKGQTKQSDSLPPSTTPSQQSGNGSPSAEHTKQDSKATGSPSDSTKDEAVNTLSGFERSSEAGVATESKVATPRVDWLGEPQVIQQRAFYKSFSVGGITFRIKDCAMFNPEGDAPPYIARIQTAWQDLKTQRNYVRVNWCYYPNDNQLPAVETLPETSDIDEVYESNHCDDNIAESIQGPCLVLTPQKHLEEKQKRAKLLASGLAGELPPIFICKWFFDTGKALFRKIGEDGSPQSS